MQRSCNLPYHMCGSSLGNYLHVAHVHPGLPSRKNYSILEVSLVILVSRCQGYEKKKGCFWWFLTKGFSTFSFFLKGRWTSGWMTSPNSFRTGGGVWCIWLLWWLEDLWNSSWRDVTGLRIIVWFLREVSSYTIFPLRFALWRISLRRSNLSSTTSEFCYRTML